MITLAATGATLRTAKYLHTRDVVKATSSLVQEVGDCCFCSCESVIPAFVYTDDVSDKTKNDWYSWIMKIPANATVEITLTDLDTETEYSITDNTYGNFYDVDELKDNVFGLIIQWYKVVQLYGYGDYSVNIVVKNAATNTIFDKTYPTFHVMPYTCEAVHGTVRIETYNSGYIEGGFDYRDLDYGGVPGTIEYGKPKGWGQQIRWYGRLSVPNIPTQIDNLSDNYRNLLQVQTMIYNEWNLRLDFIQSDVSDQMIYDNLLADYILLSDYNANNVKKYSNVKVSLLSVENTESFLNKSQNFNIKFVDYKQNLLKRFY